MIQTSDSHSSFLSEKHHKIPQQVWLLGFMMFLINVSYLMVFSYVGVYIKLILGSTTTLIGYLEGTAEALSYVMKLFSGMLSDFFMKRKPLIVIGYFLNVMSRVIFGFSVSFGPVFSARLMERFANGIQSTPRDAIVADLTHPRRIGVAYGLKRSLAQAGAFVGCFAGIGAMIWTNGNYQAVFKLAVIPAIFAFLILLFCIKEPIHSNHSAVSSGVPLPASRKRTRIKWSNFSLLGRSFWMLMIVAAIFMASRFGESFLMLHAKETFNLKSEYVAVVMMVFNAAWCLSSYPIGVLGDRLNRYWLLAIGIVFLLMADLLLASATSLGIMLVGVACWGIQYGVTLNIFLSLIAEIVPESLRGTAFGCYYIICATSAFMADVSFGHIAHTYGNTSGFLTSGIVGSCSLVFLLIIMGYKKR
jgi:MFS family permease